MKARVVWEIDVEVDGGDVMACAHDAFDAVTEPGTEATVFAVYPEGGQPKLVDLSDESIDDYVPTCELALTELDEEGNPIGSQPSQLTLASMADIISHSRQLVVLLRRRSLDDEDVSVCLGELTDAFAAAGL